MALHFNIYIYILKKKRDCADTNLISTCSSNLKLIIQDLRKQHLMQTFT